MSEILDPIDGDLESFWTRATTAGKLYRAEGVGGQSDLTSLRPGAYALGDSREMADRLCDLVLTGHKRATSSFEPAYEAEDIPLPEPGDMAILCDGSGRPRALIRTNDVRTTPFAEVGAEIAEAEGEGTVEQWHLDHEKVFREEAASYGLEFKPTSGVVTEFFEVLYQH